MKFYPNDHLPPHFHAEKGREWQVRVLFMSGPKEMIEVVYSSRKNRPNRHDLDEVVRQASAYRGELYAQWEVAVDVKTPGPER